ncbi:MAG: tRNA guanosine(34) transglycosylase Tgt [Deltaproteobacteria bacterium]|nr:tRNA guanosine(34) transglycosylase Tgt [Deltaproteobacteria bacterium]
MTLTFERLAVDGQARLGRVSTPQGTISTPVFMPVATQGALKALPPEWAAESGAQALLANAYHLHLKPGEGLVESLGGLHKFMNWPGHIITDSGGYQVFSLPDRQITEEGARFRVGKKGQPELFTPELSMAIQRRLGADIIMAFDECVAYPTPYNYAKQAMERTLRWLERSRQAWQSEGTPEKQALFGIVQGSTFADLRKESALATAALNLPGIAVGGLSVGEGLEVMTEVLGYTMPYLPEDRPRYLMGVGLPEDVLAAVEAGVDMMDCVIPTKYARAGVVFTRVGRMRLDNAEYRKDKFPLDTACGCPACTHYSRAYLHHLFQAGEILGHMLASLHNVRFYMDLMTGAREAIAQGRFAAYKRDFLEVYQRRDKKNKRVG